MPNSKALTMTSLIKTIKRRLGIRFWKLPSEDFEDELLEIIKEETLVTFSTYFPHIVRIKYNLAENKVPGMRDTFFIDKDQMGGATIVGIEDIVFDSFHSSHFPYHMPGNSFELFTDLQMSATYESMMSIPITFTFQSPDKLVIDDYPYNLDMVYLNVKIVHPDNLSTIKLTMKEQLIKLALCDIKIFLYNELKHYDKIDTTFGQIDLKIDEWQNAEDERKTLIEYWDKAFLNVRRKKIYKV